MYSSEEMNHGSQESQPEGREIQVSREDASDARQLGESQGGEGREEKEPEDYNPDSNSLKQRVAEMLSYNPFTGIFTWTNPPSGHREKIGKQAGSPRKGYLLISIDGKKYSAHRIAWLITNGELPPQIDHKNRMRADNRIENLRKCSPFENAQNHGRIINKSGLPVGVRITSSGMYLARIRHMKNLITIGTFKTQEEASCAYIQRRNILFGNFCPQ